MSVKLRFGDPVVVDQGPTLEEVGWGPYQFPAIRRLDDGRIVVRYDIVNDSIEDYGLEKGWSVSENEGKSWRRVTAEELPRIKARFGTVLPSGKCIREITPRPYPIDEKLHAALQKKIGRKKFCIGIEEIPDGLFPKDKWPFAIAGPDGCDEEEFYSDLDFPGMTVRLTSSAIVQPFMFGMMRVAPDGSLWAAHYGVGRNPETLGYNSYHAVYYFRSTDEGRSFKLMSWIQYVPDTNEHKDAYIAEGFCEPDICFMPDGSMITLLRTGSDLPSYLARSTDGGHSWTKPVKFDKCGVLPMLLHLKCGVTLASYGRPGRYIRATTDPSGLEWEEPYMLDPPVFPRRSCYYHEMLEIDERTAMLAYTDFHVKDSQGVERKSILVRTIHVEEQ